MRKIQVLFPGPTLDRLRNRARWEDRPMSELIRRATERWLDSLPDAPPPPGQVPILETFSLGLKVPDPRLQKAAIYDRE